MSDTDQTFDQWCLVEVMGHQRFAGKVTEQVIGGSSFVRVDVPAVEGRQPFTKLFGSGSIYCITPMDEETARGLAGHFQQQPVEEWSARCALGVQPSVLDHDDHHDIPL